MAGKGRRRGRRVRLFPDYADSVIWLSGPCSYETTHISVQLAESLNAWEAFYYSSLTADLDFTSKKRAKAFTAKGRRLAGLLADEIGPEFEVEFKSYEKRATTFRVRSDRAAQNPAAAKAFTDMADAVAEEERLIMEAPSDFDDGYFMPVKDFDPGRGEP
jgi:hypothetical protein